MRQKAVSFKIRKANILQNSPNSFLDKLKIEPVLNVHAKFHDRLLPTSAIIKVSNDMGAAPQFCGTELVDIRERERKRMLKNSCNKVLVQLQVMLR